MFESDKLIILNYPIGAGGKFLANCLGLAPNAVLQDRTLARQQLDGNLSPYDKFNLIMQRVSEVGKEWNDLELGCGKFFGDNCFFNRRSYTETDFYRSEEHTSELQSH